MKVKALKSFATKYGNATKGQVIKVSDEAGKKLQELKFAEKTNEEPQPQTQPEPAGKEV